MAGSSDYFRFSSAVNLTGILDIRGEPTNVESFNVTFVFPNGSCEICR